MNTPRQHTGARKLILTAAAALLCSSLTLSNKVSAQSGDGSYNMAPPVQAPPDTSNAPEAATVFNWQELPVNQEVPIVQAVFDQGGYQLYDTQGETIVVRFKNDNLYVMKFGLSNDGSTYFVNSGSSPILYLPQNGYLENATVDGARWYPFGADFTPSSPVYLGIAPSWSDYDTIGWYPDMYCYGGYWCGSGFGIFQPSFGLYISFGGHRFNGWSDYGRYTNHYPAPYRMGYSNHNAYTYAGRSYWGSRSFQRTYNHSLSARIGLNGANGQRSTFRGGGNQYSIRGAGQHYNGGTEHQNTFRGGSSYQGTYRPAQSSGGSFGGGSTFHGGGGGSHGGGRH